MEIPFGWYIFIRALFAVIRIEPLAYDIPSGINDQNKSIYVYNKESMAWLQTVAYIYKRIPKYIAI